MNKKDKSQVNEILLKRYGSVADGIATLFFPYAEVVIHELVSQSVLYLANNLSKRSLGDDSALEEIEHSKQEDVIGPYEKLNWDGRKMRSVSMVLFDDAENAIGMMCINFNVAVFEDAKSVLDTFIKGVGVVAQPAELFKDDWQERINTFLHRWLHEHQVSLNSLTRDHRRALVEALFKEGAFNGKSSADYIAKVLNMGRATVYKYLKEMK
ncbi:transcriptional regulator [Aquitalea sp. LB_tupeE]|uniref:helix-turn-helix transcriptional regulator n=1 Tax=Aquitalea sp. LB_tupeE TaxID=2748078 RepID=UPI0015BC7875|nr:PAS domain-containing protein [Aquitalea sp. LB_tupeE]NWK80199.1 PAS domain-containing protein [Aquitalea sp. LB_tupeE]